MKFHVRAVVLLSCWLTGSSLGDTPDARAILQQAQAALRAVSAITYEGEGQTGGVLAAHVPTIRGRVTLASPAGSELPRLYAEVELTPPAPRPPVKARIASDGQQVTLVDHTQKVYVNRPLPAGALLLNNVTALLIREFTAQDPFQRELEATSLEHNGAEKVGDTECDVIQVVFPEGAGEARWYIARSDHLPRRVVRIIETPRGQATITTTLTRLELNPELSPDLFRLEKPQDFQEIGLTPRAAGPRQFLELGSTAPEWTLRDGHGRVVSLQSLRGKIVVLDFWATWCAPCRMMMPVLQRIHDKYKNQAVAVYGVNCRERSPRADPLGFISKLGHTYPQLLEGDRMASAYQVAGLPTLYVIGPDGKIVLAKSGFSPVVEVELTRLIDGLLRPLPATSQPTE